MGAEKLPNVPSESQIEQGSGTLKTTNLFSHLLLLLKLFQNKGLGTLKHSGSEGRTSH